MSKAEEDEDEEVSARRAASDGVIKAGAVSLGAEEGAGVDGNSFFSGVPMNEE